MDGVTVIGSRSLFRAGLVSLLSTIGFTPIEETDDTEHLRQHNGSKPVSDLVIGLVRGVENIISAVGEVKALLPTAKVVLVAPELDIEIMSGCFAAGASGYLLESISRDALRESLKLVNSGEKVFPSELASLFPMITSSFGEASASATIPTKSDLSTREIEILRCLTNGQSNKAIAKDLDIAEATVKVHVKRILRKAHVVNRTQAALWGVATGIAATSPHSKVVSVPPAVFGTPD